MKRPKQATPQRQRVDLWLSGAGEGGRVMTANGDGVVFEADENILKLDKDDSCRIL